MKLSTRGKYGLYAMIFLAQHEGEGPQSLKAFSALGTPEAYLEQLLGTGSLTAKQKPKVLESSQGLIFLSSFKELLLRNMQ